MPGYAGGRRLEHVARAVYVDVVHEGVVSQGVDDEGQVHHHFDVVQGEEVDDGGVPHVEAVELHLGGGIARGVEVHPDDLRRLFAFVQEAQ